MKKFYPIMLDISDKECIIIGGGKVAYRKAASLLEYNAIVLIISNNLCEDLIKLKDTNKIRWISKSYEDGDLKGAFLAFAATDDKAINQQVFEEAQMNNIPVNVVEDQELCNFTVPSKIEQGDLTIAVSTNGKSPALSKKIRKELEENYSPAYGELLELLGEARIKAIKEISDINSRENLFRELVYSNIIDYLKAKQAEQAKQELQRIFDKYKHH